MEKLLENQILETIKKIKKMNNLLKKFKENNISISWKTIIVGRKLGLANASFIEEFATDCLINNSKIKNQYIAELASGITDNFEIDQLLSKISQSMNIILDEESIEYDAEIRKWRYVVLVQLLDKKYGNEDLLQKIEEIYADFDYPEDMRNLIYYIPSGTFDPTKFSREECLQRLVNLFNEFLIKEQRELSN